MSRLASFFHGFGTRLGNFYPDHYLLALFPTLGEAEQARRSLVQASFEAEAAIAVPGEELVLFFEEHAHCDGLFGWVMRGLSCAFGTEAAYAERDVEMARRGAALVVVHCPTRRAKVEAWRCLGPVQPLAARYYAFSGIEHLVGE